MDVFIAIEDDGSQWVMLEDYQALQQKYLINELSLDEQIKRNSMLLQRNQQPDPYKVDIVIHIQKCPHCGGEIHIPEVRGNT